MYVIITILFVLMIRTSFLFKIGVYHWSTRSRPEPPRAGAGAAGAEIVLSNIHEPSPERP